MEILTNKIHRKALKEIFKDKWYAIKRNEKIKIILKNKHHEKNKI